MRKSVLVPVSLAAVGFIAGCSSACGPMTTSKPVTPAPAASSATATAVTPPVAKAVDAGGLVCGFESPAEVAACAAVLENSTLDLANDKGVTQGKSCLKFTAKKGTDYASFCLGKDVLGAFSGAKTMTVDIYTDEPNAVELRMQLWDDKSVDSSSRCTMPMDLKKGRQEVKWDISAPVRNGSGHTPINMQKLAKVKFYVVPPADHDMVIYFDNIRLSK